MVCRHTMNVVEKQLLQFESSTSPMGHFQWLLHRKRACGGKFDGSGECEECKKKRLQSSAFHVQSKLAIIDPGEALEREAVHAAYAVISDSIAPISKLTPVNKSGPAGFDPAPPIVSEVLQSSGQPLDPEIRARMTQRFGYDFGGVRMHMDVKAAELARAVNALAYTIGQHIVFKAGQYAPGTTSSQQLLAHELTHVLQQEGGAHMALLRQSVNRESGEPDEEEAKQLATEAVAIPEEPTAPATKGAKKPRRAKRLAQESSWLREVVRTLSLVGNHHFDSL